MKNADARRRKKRAPELLARCAAELNFWIANAFYVASALTVNIAVRRVRD